MGAPVVAFTTLAAEATLLSTAAAASDLVEVDQIGTSVNGNPVWLVRIGNPPPAQTDRVDALLAGCNHGNEPAGREALLEIVEDLGNGDSATEALFAGLTVMIAPTVNPDGFELDQRENANGADLNRDWIALAEPETQALAAVLGTARPRLVYDTHEAIGAIDPTNHVEYRGSAVANAYSGLNDLSVELRDRLIAWADTNGWDAGLYLGGTVFDNITQLDASSSMRHSVVQLVETNRGTGFDDETQRTLIQRQGIEETLRFTGDRTDDVGTAVANSEADAAATLIDPYTLRSASNLDPPPSSYQLTNTQVSVFADHAAAFAVAVSGNTVTMLQAAQRIIPILMDPASVDRIITATAVFAGDESEPSDPVPEVGQARITTRMVWLGCDLITGGVIAELHDITGSVSRLLGAYASAQLTVPIPLDPTGRAPLATVVQATRPAETMIVAVVNDLPIWAGIPLPRERGTDAEMPLGCVTLEGYLDRRYVGDHDLIDVDESVIFSALIEEANIEGIGLVIDAPPTGRTRTRTFRDHDDATTYQRLQELSQVRDGPEWTVDLDWLDADENVVRKIARMRPRLGVAAEPPAALFRTSAASVFSGRGGSEARYTYREDFTDGRYANHILPVGSGEGEDRVQGEAARDEAALAAGRARWEMRVRPSTSITDVNLLTEYGQAELARRRNGALTWKIEARWDAWPRYGIDWRPGDDIAWELVGHGHPQGVTGQGRAIGVEIDPQKGTLSPILLDPASIGEE